MNAVHDHVSNASNRKKKLQKAVEELKGVPLTTGILYDVQLEPCKDEKDFKVVFTKRLFRSLQEQTLDTKTETEQEACSDEATVLVLYFHQKLNRPDHVPANRECGQANGLIIQHGLEAARFVVDYAIREARKTDFAMRTFGAVLQYQGEALASYFHQHQQQELFSAEQRPEPDEAASPEQEFLIESHEEREARLQAEFDELDADTQSRLRESAA